MSVRRPAIVIGGGGHAKVLVDLLLALGYDVLGFTDRDPRVDNFLLGVRCVGSDDVIAQRWQPNEVHLVNGVGSIGAPQARVAVFDEFVRQGFTFATLVHPAATVSPNAILDQGVQVMAGAVIQAGSRIGRNTIVNTRASIDHDCDIAAHVHVAPCAVLSGGVRVGTRAHIGCGATVLQGLALGMDSIVGGGAAVIRDVPPGVTVAGVPAKMLRRSSLTLTRTAAGG